MNGYKTIRVRSTGQVTEMVPDVARAMINSGMAEEVGSPSSSGDRVKPESKPESTAVAPAGERAVAPAQAGPTKKPGLFSRKNKNRSR
ncbi:MAG TPA: hypothetical protein VGM18_04935 [Candidatus Sulfotelmatobacter sp.]|jgi:hypothetical protein